MGLGLPVLEWGVRDWGYLYWNGVCGVGVTCIGVECDGLVKRNSEVSHTRGITRAMAKPK